MRRNIINISGCASDENRLGLGDIIMHIYKLAEILAQIMIK